MTRTCSEQRSRLARGERSATSCPQAVTAGQRCVCHIPPPPHVSGPAYDLTFCEVRDTSLVLLWKAPVYSGNSPVSGYFVDYKEEGSEDWVTVNEAATGDRYLKVTVPPGALSL